jgi:hypothetical protein
MQKGPIPPELNDVPSALLLPPPYSNECFVVLWTSAHAVQGAARDDNGDYCNNSFEPVHRVMPNVKLSRSRRDKPGA